MRGALGEEHMAAIVAYVDGHMTEAEQIAFELQLMDRPELARALEEMVASYPMREALARRPSEARAAAPGWWRGLLAAAAMIAAVAGLATWTEFAPPTTPIAVVRAAGNADEFVASIATLRGEVIPWSTGRLRGDPDSSPESTVSATEALERAARELDRARPRTRHTQTGPVQAEFFRVVVDLPQAATVLVASRPISSDSASSFAILFPEGLAADSGRLPAGLNYLPAPPLRVAENGLLSFVPGFVRRESQARIEVLVAVRTEPLDAPTAARIDRTLRLGEPLPELLRALGFETSTVLVSE